MKKRKEKENILHNEDVNLKLNVRKCVRKALIIQLTHSFITTYLIKQLTIKRTVKI